MRIPINSGSRQQRAEEIAEQDPIHYNTGLQTPAHPISEVRPEENRETQSGRDSSGSYERGKEMTGDPDIATEAVTDDAARGEVQVGPVGTEVGSNSGGATTGGDLTPEQDAGEAMDEVKRNLEESAGIEEQQQEGLMEEQREDLKPSVNNPEEGTPSNPDEKENSGGANPQEGGSDSAASASTPSEGAVNRAAAEHDERFLRLAADFENYKRVVTRRETEVRERAARNVLEDFLPVLDNFERAVQASQNVSGDPAVRNLVVGVQGILMQMEGALRSHGVQPMDTKGQKFDPLLHEAIEAVEGSGQPEGTVVSEAQRGYTLNGAVLRPATVRVAA